MSQPCLKAVGSKLTYPCHLLKGHAGECRPLAINLPGTEEVELRQWWVATAQQDFDDYYKKSVEYGSCDLDLMGEAISHIQGEISGVFDGHERAIGFYLFGKLARMVGAWAKGKEPSDDTVHDIVVYAMMIRLRRRGRKLTDETGTHQ